MMDSVSIAEPHPGAQWDPLLSKWRAPYTLSSGINVPLGHFDDEGEAASKSVLDLPEDMATEELGDIQEEIASSSLSLFSSSLSSYTQDYRQSLRHNPAPSSKVALSSEITQFKGRKAFCCKYILSALIFLMDCAIHIACIG